MINLLEKSKYPIIILEGPDGVGKTTLAEALQEYLGARYIHLTYRWKDKMDLYHRSAIMNCAHLAQHHPVILDRWWISEILYAEAYRGGSKFMKSFFLLDYVATKIGAVYVACLPEDRERYIQHYHVLKDSRAEMYDEGMERVFDLYTSFYNQYLCLKDNVTRYDMFQNFNDNEVSRGIVMRNICQNVLEITEDYRSTL